MSKSSIQGQLLEVTVIGCNKLKDTEWISRQDPYVCLEYGSTKYRTRTDTDGGKDPVFQEKYTFTLIEGLRELNVAVWNSNTIKSDTFIGAGKVQLQKVLSDGVDDTAWTINTRSGRYAGEVRLMLKYFRATVTSNAPSAPPYEPSHQPQVPQYPMPPPSPASYGHPQYPMPPPSPASYGHPPTSYPAPPSYPAYPPSPSHASYPPPYSTPPSPYPPAPYPYPYPQQHPSHYPPGSYQGAYPRPGY